MRDYLPAEEYYKKLLQDEQNQRQPPSAGDKPGEGECGGAASDESNPEADAEGVPGLKPEEKELIKKDTARQASTGAGVDAGDREWAKQLLNKTSKLNWKQMIKSQLKKIKRLNSGADDYSYRRPSRRSLNHRIIKPSMIGYSPEIFVVLDTSGSMGSDLENCLAEIEKIIQAEHIPIKAVCVDTRTHKMQTIKKASDLIPRGGGGTDMRVGIKMAQEEGANICIVITDGLTPWPKSKPKNMDTIICLTRKSRSMPHWA